MFRRTSLIVMLTSLLFVGLSGWMKPALLSADPSVSAAPGLGNWEARADPFSVTATLGKSLIEPGKAQTNFLKVGVTGAAVTSARPRPPLNVAIVLDCSGSMFGRKLEAAKEAALYAISKLGPTDSFSLTVFAGAAKVVIPSSHPDVFTEGTSRTIRDVCAGGGTNLYDALLLGASEVRKTWRPDSVNRIILVSDGVPTVGVCGPGEIVALGQSVAQSGVSITTLGIGDDFNQDLLKRLALVSEGNHAFVKNADELLPVFTREYGNLLQVAATRINITVTCRGMRLVRSLGRPGIIDGQTITTTLDQVYGNQEKYLLVEVEVPSSASPLDPPVADIAVCGFDPIVRTAVQLTGRVAMGFSTDPADVKRAWDEGPGGTTGSGRGDIESRKPVDQIKQGDVPAACSTMKPDLKTVMGSKATYSNLKTALTEYVADCTRFPDQSGLPMTPAQREELLKKMSENLHHGASQQGW